MGTTHSQPLCSLNLPCHELCSHTMICQMSPLFLKSFHFPEPNCRLELILYTPWISTPPFSPSAEAKCWSMPEKMDSGLFFTSLCLHQHTMPAQPMALCLHNTAELREVFCLPSSKSVKCFLLDQKRGKLVNHTPNAVVTCQLPRTAVCMLPANCRCSLLLQAQLSIIPGIKHQDSVKRPL